jgi:hypothetical protein
MKTLIILLSMLVAGTVAARPPHPAPLPNDNSARTTIVVPWQPDLTPKAPEKPNEVVIGKHTYSGVAVQLVKTKNPLQLINPLAPPEYGYGHENLDRDVITRKVHYGAFKIFSVSF